MIFLAHLAHGLVWFYGVDIVAFSFIGGGKEDPEKTTDLPHPILGPGGPSWP
jgi:hypothetical protein